VRTFDLPLSRREIQVAQLVTHGLSNLEIADRLGIKEQTIHVHIANILRTLGYARRTQVAIWALKAGIVRLENIELPEMPEPAEKSEEVCSDIL